MGNTGIPQPNTIFLHVAYLMLGSLFRVMFRLTIRRNEDTLKQLSTQPRPLIIVFNHTSHLDVPLVGLCIGIDLMRRVTLPGKKELLEDPKTRWIMNLAGVVPLKRDASDTAAVRVLLRALQAGRCIVMAPEGTRSDDGSVQPFKAGFVKLAQRANALILPVGITGAANALPRGTSFPRPRKLIVQMGDLIDPVGLLASNTDPATVDHVAELVRQRIIGLVTGTCMPGTA